MQHHHSFGRGTRQKFRKDYRSKGKLSIRKFFQEFKEGDKVVLKVEPSYHKGRYYPRFHGKIGYITGKQGECYNVLIKDGNKDKMIIVHPVHLVRSN
ncbi:MAG: 50S ribosomal protein L21e [Candidatus Woesearchaeota archaeon]